MVLEQVCTYKTVNKRKDAATGFVADAVLKILVCNKECPRSIASLGVGEKE